ncbi:spermidine synthase [Legionella worsleiensis]|uniref:Spermidine synthase n=1 Tax=Legionella worsleiensis TaxID=45076 RepID=A0A0W1A417_9GAMM|nr:fused MFS/spermidine synthase [Legionella worsleiensis]KTD76108.1 spermidine synthase [Legionella worsleiensis]STY33314.1 spermidine synthase [Legionella worsleiensis]
MWKTKFGHCIYTSSSGFQVFENPGYRWLTLGSSALQTVINKRKPYKPILRYLPSLSLMTRHYPENCCVLGLGGGGIAHMLFHNNPNQPITAVECSEEIIQIAKQFFMVQRLTNLKIIHQNAEDFLQEKNFEYKHLIVDLYDAHHFPQECATDDFFNSCRNSLKEDGFLAVNLANYKEQWALVQTIKQHFTATIIIPVKHCANLIVIASRNSSKEILMDSIVATKEIKKLVWTHSWGLVGEY